MDDAAFGGATSVEPKFISPTDPAARWTAAIGGPAFYAYATNYLIDLKHAVIVDVEALDRRAPGRGHRHQDHDRRVREVDLSPNASSGRHRYGSAEMLAWLVDEQHIEPHIPVFDKSGREDGTFSRERLQLRPARRHLPLSRGKTLSTTPAFRAANAPKRHLVYRASKHDCDACD